LFTGLIELFTKLLAIILVSKYHKVNPNLLNKFMQQSRFFTLCIGASFLLCACSPPSSSAPETSENIAPQILLSLPGGKATVLEDLPLERVSRSGIHRDAQLVTAGVTKMDFRVEDKHHTLVFSVLPAEGSSVQMSVYEDGQGQSLPAATSDASWSLRRVVLNGSKSLSLVLESKQPFHLAACRLVGATSKRPDVLIYLIDTLRQDHLSCYNYPLNTSPNIDRFAEDAIRFFSLIPMSSWTRPSVATLLTGVMDYTHHALSQEDHLREGLPSLAKTLEMGGWTTHGITSSCVITSAFGFGGDFQWYEEILLPNNLPLPEADVKAVDRAVAAITEADKENPFFMYLHVVAPHRDYEPPAEYKNMFMPERFVGTKDQTRVMQDMAYYDAEIRFSDDQFARVIQALRDTGRYENTLIILLSDHGEQFMEHGELAHAKTLHYHELEVPFLVKLPGNAHAGQEVRHIVQMADVAPTVLNAVGLNIPTQMEGRSLMPLITLEGTFPPKPAFARLRIDDRHLYMSQTLDLKYVYDVVRQQGQWYDLQEDYLEMRPLFTPPEGGEALRAFAEEQAAKPVPDKGVVSPPLTKVQTEQLEALGYL